MLITINRVINYHIQITYLLFINWLTYSTSHKHERMMGIQTHLNKSNTTKFLKFLHPIFKILETNCMNCESGNDGCRHFIYLFNLSFIYSRQFTKELKVNVKVYQALTFTLKKCLLEEHKIKKIVTT